MKVTVFIRPLCQFFRKNSGFLISAAEDRRAAGLENVLARLDGAACFL